MRYDIYDGDIRLATLIADNEGHAWHVLFEILTRGMFGKVKIEPSPNHCMSCYRSFSNTQLSDNGYCEKCLDKILRRL
jgi:hypothetical protein